MSYDKDSLPNTFKVAISLCLVCALLVSAAAVGLKSRQDANALADRQVNILRVAGFTEEEIDEVGIGELFKANFETHIIDLESGELAAEECQVAVEAAGKKVGNIVQEYDQIWCSKSKKKSVSDKLGKKADIVGIKYREKYSQVFTLQSEDGKIIKYVFPVRGYGLWSMMQGYMAVEPDLATVAGLTFYAQGETPGLGGEVENKKWKAKWPGKKLYAASGEVALKVSKGDQSENENGVDALSGATITSNGVTNLVKFWMGKQGFGPYIDKQKSSPSQPTADNVKANTNVLKSANIAPAKSGDNRG